MESNSRKAFLLVWEWRFYNSKKSNPWNRYFEPQHFFFLLPILPSLLHLLLIRATFFFLIQIFILFYLFLLQLQYTREERERERVVKTECRVGVGGNGGWWVSKLLFGGDSGVCQFCNSNRQWWFQLPIWYCMWRSNSIQVQDYHCEVPQYLIFFF